VKRSRKEPRCRTLRKDFGSWSGWTGQRDAAQEPLHALPGVRGEYEQAVDLLGGCSPREDGHPEYAELKRRFGVEWKRDDALQRILLRETSAARAPSIRPRSSGRRSPPEFGSAGKWEADFGRGRDGGIAVVSTRQGGRPSVQPWVNETTWGTGRRSAPRHDVFEHAFMVDYG